MGADADASADEAAGVAVAIFRPLAATAVAASAGPAGPDATARPTRPPRSEGSPRARETDAEAAEILSLPIQSGSPEDCRETAGAWEHVAQSAVAGAE